ncbi:MTFP1.2 family protein [Megaselia abdita]
MTSSQNDKDIYRDTYIRYLGYANEVGEAFRPLVHKQIVNLSYGVSISYVLADAFDKATKEHKQSGNLKKVAIKASDVFIWQIIASVIIPGITINRVTWLTSRALKNSGLKKEIRKIVPTVVGLASIPVIIKPIDHFVDLVMDKTFRKFFH